MQLEYGTVRFHLAIHFFVDTWCVYVLKVIKTTWIFFSVFFQSFFSFTTCLMRQRGTFSGTLVLWKIWRQFGGTSVIARILLSLFATLIMATIHMLFVDDMHQTTLSSHDIPFADSIESARSRLTGTKSVLFGYGQNCCATALKRLCEHALGDASFDECLALNASALAADFRKEHADILSEWRGAGYWLWKPYLIHQLLTDATLSDGDYLVYMDAGAYPKRDLSDMFEFVETHAEFGGVLFFGVGLPQREWCKRDAYILQRCDATKCWDAGQINAFMSIWRKGRFAVELSRMWLEEAANASILADGESRLGEELSGFRDHRHDQAVITNIMNREGYPYGPSGWQLDDYIVHDRFTF